jgi:hypothetical protein
MKTEHIKALTKFKKQKAIPFTDLIWHVKDLGSVRSTDRCSIVIKNTDPHQTTTTKDLLENKTTDGNYNVPYIGYLLDKKGKHLFSANLDFLIDTLQAIKIAHGKQKQPVSINVSLANHVIMLETDQCIGLCIKNKE